MINNYIDYKHYIEVEKPLYSCYSNSKLQLLKYDFLHFHVREVWKYVKMLRQCEYLLNSSGFRFIKIVFFYILERKRNKLGNKLGIWISPNVCEEGLFLEHYGIIMISPFAKIGKGLHLHGDCVIGASGYSTDVPTVGDNVDIGWGAILRGKITIADNVVIGANAVVTKNITKAGEIWAGIPAKKIGMKN